MNNSFGIIRDESAYNTALKRIQEIFFAEEGTSESDEMELLSILVEEYENKNYKIPEVEPLQIISFIMEQNSLKQNDLIGILGDKTTVSKVLNRKRPLTLEMIRNFSKRFNISADLLIKDYKLEVS